MVADALPPFAVSVCAMYPVALGQPGVWHLTVSMIDLRHPLGVLTTRIPWASSEATIAPLLERRAREGEVTEGTDLLSVAPVLAEVGPGPAGRPRLPLRPMVGLL